MQVYRIYQLSLYKKPLQAFLFARTKAVAGFFAELVCCLHKSCTTRSLLLPNSIPQQLNTRHSIFFQNKNTTI